MAEDSNRKEPIVKISSLASLFGDDGKKFSLRRELPETTETDQLVPRDWHQIALDFLNRPDSAFPFPLDEPETFDSIDTTRASEFVAGRGSFDWHDLKRDVLEDSKEKRRRARR